MWGADQVEERERGELMPFTTPFLLLKEMQTIEENREDVFKSKRKKIRESSKGYIGVKRG